MFLDRQNLAFLDGTPFTLQDAFRVLRILKPSFGSIARKGPGSHFMEPKESQIEKAHSISES